MDKHSSNNCFANPTLPLLSGAIHIAQRGLTAGRQASRQAGRQKIYKFKLLKFAIDQSFKTFQCI